ncbi:MAG: hypothetical protein ACTSRG_24590 [Candidatus Helarchaeota archaeon]
MRFKLLKSNIKYLLKHILWKTLNQHNPIKKSNICIFTSRRCGGTWLTEVMSSEKGMKFIIEPYATGSKDPFLKNIFPKEILKTTIPKHQRDEKWMYWFNWSIFNGKIHLQEPWNIFNKPFNFRTNRVCMKIHMAKSWIDWYQKEFSNCNIVYYLRHPIPQALSSINIGAKILIRENLEDEFIIKKYFNNKQLDFAYRVKNEGTILEKYILTYILENIVPIRLYEKNDWLTLTYEELVINRINILEILIKRLNLTSSAIYRQAEMPSKTVRSKMTAKKIESEDKKYLLKRWMDKVTNDEKRKAQTILDAFEINFYNAYSPYPSSKILNKKESIDLFSSL